MSISLRVLIVEGSEDDASLLLWELQRGGYEPTSARVATAEDFSAALDDEAWDIVIADYTLPGFGALQARTLLKDRHLDLPLIVVSGAIGEEAAAAAMKAGAHDCLMKGNLARLGAAVERELREAEVRRARKQGEEALRDSEKQFRDLFEKSPDAIIVENQDGNVLEVNPAACRLYAMDRQNLVGKHFLELVPPDRREEVARDFPNVVSGKWDHLEGCSWAKDGGAIPVEIRVSRFHYAGNPALLLHVRDISKRKRTEDELRRSEERFKAIFENATDGLLLADPETRRFLDGNQKICQMLACSLEELKNLGVSDVHPKDDMPYVVDQFEKQRRREITLARDIPVRRRDGTVFYADVNSAPITLAGKTYLMGIFRDVTERKRAEGELKKHGERLEELVQDRTAALTKANEELQREIAERKQAEETVRESEARYRQIVETATEGVWMLDAEANTRFVNRRLGEMLGYTAEEMAGKSVFEFMAQADRAMAEQNIERCRRGQGERHDLRFRCKDGTGLWAIVSTSPIVDKKGQYVGGLGMLTDITDRKRAEEQVKASLREKEVLLKEIHHRVKNNMQVISSLLNLQSQQIEDERAREMFRDTRSRVLSMAMVHQQLYESRDLARVDFAKHVRNLASYLFRSYAATSGTIEFQEGIQDVPLTLGVAIPCGLIINELVSNALKHAFPNGRKGEIRVGLDLEGDRFVLTVFDNGIGFPAELDYRATTTMGLRVVTTLAGQLNGAMELDRRGGTTFKITFPESEQISAGPANLSASASR